MPSFVLLLFAVDHLYYAWVRKSATEAGRKETYDQVGKADEEDDGVQAEDVDIVLSVDDPLGDGNANSGLLRSVWIVVFLPVFPRDLVRKSAGEREWRARGDSENYTHALYALVILTKRSWIISRVSSAVALILSG